MTGYVEKQRSRNINDVPKELNRQPSIVIMGDGYTLADMEKFRQDAQNLEKYLFDPVEGVSPFNKTPFSNYFNIFTIFLNSEERGIGDGRAKNTILRCFYDQNMIRFDDVNFFGGRKAPSPYDVAQQFVPGINLINTIVVVLVNDTKICYSTGYRNVAFGGGNWISLIPADVDPQEFRRLVIREVGGRGFGRLAPLGTFFDTDLIKLWYDLYGFFANVDITDDTRTVRWAHFINIGYPAVGVNSVGYGVYCPNLYNVMNVNSGSFEYDGPSREAIIKRIYSIHGPEWSWDNMAFNIYFGGNPPRI